MQETSISVVILNWNGLHYLKKFLPGVVEYSTEAEIVIADNASDDGSVEWVKSNFPGVRIILFEKNLGFCKGYNEALKQINSEYYVLLNSDVEVSRDWLKPLKKTLDSDKNIAAAQPKILWQTNKEYFEYAGAAGGFIDKYGYPFCRGRILQSLEKDEGQYDKPGDIFWASGACMFIRAEIYHRFGGLDELFFAHMEEIDLCWRILNHGFQIRYVPESTVFHIGGGTLHKSNPHKTYLNHRNSLLLLYKNLPDKVRAYKVNQRLVLDGLSALIYFLQLKFGDFRALIRAHNHFRRMKKEVEVSDRRENPENLHGFYNKSILLDYFVRRIRKFSQLDFD